MLTLVAVISGGLIGALATYLAMSIQQVGEVEVQLTLEQAMAVHWRLGRVTFVEGLQTFPGCKERPPDHVDAMEAYQELEAAIHLATRCKALRVISRMGRPAKKAAKAVKRFGASMDKSTGAFRRFGVAWESTQGTRVPEVELEEGGNGENGKGEQPDRDQGAGRAEGAGPGRGQGGGADPVK